MGEDLPPNFIKLGFGQFSDMLSIVIMLKDDLILVRSLYMHCFSHAVELPATIGHSDVHIRIQ